MKYPVLLSLALLFAFTASSQTKQISILGKVLDSATHQPLAGASAFCQNTTYGTISNAEGLFFLRLPSGGYDLVISYTGYEKSITRIGNNQNPNDTLIILLAKQEQSLGEVAVVASNEVEDGWNKYGSFFSKHFIGNTPFASLCTIENPEALRFFYTKTKKRHRLRVTAKEDLVIRNDALGYRIRYQLDSFSYDYNSNISQYTGFPFFEQLDSTEEVKSKWNTNRAKAYLGSRLHFMRSYFDANLTEEGFVVEKMNKNDPKAVSGVEIKELYDSTLYESDSSSVQVNLDGRYRVLYKKVLPDPAFLKDFNLPATTTRQVTILNVDGGFVIEENGYFYEQYDVINSGYWAWKKLGDALPYDYEY